MNELRARVFPALCVVAALTLAGGSVQAKEAVAKVTRRGPWVTYRFPLAAPAQRAALARGEAELRLLVEGPEARLRTRRYLPPGAYELVLDGKRQPARVGTPDEGKAAQARLEEWLRGAHGTFSQLSATLEGRGRFHLGLRAAGREPHLGAFRGSFLAESWGPGLISARMDLALFRRRVLLPYKPGALPLLERLAELLTKRRAAWEACLLKEGPDPGEASEVLAAATELEALLGATLPWSAGPLGTPPPVAKKGALFEDPIGYRLAIPAGAEVQEARDPVDRLSFSVEGALVVVRVLELPGAADEAALRERVERDAFERWTSYKQLRATEGPGSLRLEFAARVALRSERAGARGNARVLQWARLQPPGKALLLIALRPEGKPLPEAVKALFTPEAFQLVGGK